MDEQQPDRRKIDVDHDLLVQLARDMKHLCHKHDKNHDEVRNDIKEVHARIDKQAEGCKLTHIGCSNFFVPRYVFYWAVAIVFLSMTFVGGVAITNQNAISNHQGYSEQATKRIDDSIDKLNHKVWTLDTIPDYKEDTAKDN